MAAGLADLPSGNVTGMRKKVSGGGEGGLKHHQINYRSMNRLYAMQIVDVVALVVMQ